MGTSARTVIFPLGIATLLAGAASLAPSPGAAQQAARPGPGAPTELRVDAKTSRLTVETETVGLSSLFGHDHKFYARDLSGRLSMVPGRPESAVLELTVRADALTLVEDVSDDTHREIDTALRELVLETGKYPQIAFRSRSVTARKNEDGSFDVKLAGDLVLHGVRRRITLPASVTETPDGIRATGAVELRQSDFKIKPFTFAKGTVKVRDVVVLSFDVVGKR
jgi:polyisoprenoid-binding protein YceI